MGQRQPFLNIRSEGALLPADLLSRLVEGTNLKGLKPEDYHLGAGEKVTEAVSRSWARLLSLWSSFRKAQAALQSSDLGTTLTREKWVLQLFQELGYGRLIVANSFEIEGKTYPISHVWQGQYYQVPIHLVSFRADLDKRSEQRIQGASKASPHGMVQEFLNRSEHHLWAFVSNGLKLLILRDNASLTRQAYVEFDLEGIFEGAAYADFRLLWMLCHQSRLEGTTKGRPETCWLEAWSKQAQTDGRRALDQLRVGVQKALENLGTGFIAHKANQTLRDRLQAGELNKQDLYRQLLRLVYRLIFLFVAEDRDLLHFPGATDDAKLRYASFYSGQRLRRMAERTRGSRHADLWVGLRLVFARLGDDRGCPELGLPALGGFLFGPKAMPDLESAELANEHLLQAIRNLGMVKDRNGWRLVDYRNLGSEELGSVYESLLELTPTMELAASVFSLGTVAGNQRKTSGSYYTPDSLVQCLLDSALEPVVEQAVKGKTAAEAERAILALKVCDPAVGSGHFLVGAAHRLAKHLSQVRAQALGESEPSPLYYQAALRDIIGHCLYGVDVNPMAAELCRVSLWLEAIEPGKPLSFLDHHIRVGNSLLGTTPALLEKGISDEAFTPIEGDDREICSRFKRVNKDERDGQGRLFIATTEPWERLGDLATSMMHLDSAPDDSIVAIRNKERMYEAMVRSGSYLVGQFWADTWCAAFLWKKTREFNYPITEEVFRRIEHNPHSCDGWMRTEIERLAGEYQFFHWHLAFPEVFFVPTGKDAAENELTGWNGGFDLVLGNPPWERVKLQEEEYFAVREPAIAKAKNASARKKMIAALPTSNPHLAMEWATAVRRAENESGFLRLSGRYPLGGVGDVNTYAVFADLFRQLTNPEGSAALLLPNGLVTGFTYRSFLRELLESRTLASFYGFENEDKIFPAVHNETKFGILTMTGQGHPVSCPWFTAHLRQAEQVHDPLRRYSLTAEQIELISPNTLNLPAFRWAGDAEVAAAVHAAAPALIRRYEDGRVENPWDVSFLTMFHMANDSGLFMDHADVALRVIGRRGAMAILDNGTQVYPLYEGKMAWHFDHRYGTYAGQTVKQANKGVLPHVNDVTHGNPEYRIQPRYWVDADATIAALGEHSDREWFFSWRDVGIAERTFIGCAIPVTATGHKSPVLLSRRSPLEVAGLIGLLSSFVVDYDARQRANGMSFFVVEQLPILTPAYLTQQCSWLGTSYCGWLTDRVLELSYTNVELAGFAHDLGFLNPPFRWNPERRLALQAEIDALVLHAYGLTRIQADWILDSFAVLRKYEEGDLGEYRTKRVILEIYDAMAEAARTGSPYQTRLDPPPSDPRCCHPARDESGSTLP